MKSLFVVLVQLQLRSAPLSQNCFNSVYYQNKHFTFCEKRTDLTESTILNQINFNKNENIFINIYTEKTKQLTLNLTVSAEQLPNFAAFGLVGAVTVQKSIISVNVEAKLLNGALICIQCNTEIVEAKMAFIAEGQLLSGLILNVENKMEVNNSLIQFRLGGKAIGGFSADTTQNSVFSLSTCNISGYVMYGEVNGVISAQNKLQILVRAQNIQICTNGMSNGNLSLITIDGIILENCDICNEQFIYAYGICSQDLQYSLVNDQKLVCADNFYFDGQQCTCDENYILNGSSCVNLLQQTNEIKNNIQYQLELIETKASNSQIIDLEKRIINMIDQSQKQSQKLIENVDSDCQNKIYELNNNIQQLKDENFLLKQQIISLESNITTNYYTKLETDQIILPLKCPIGAKVVENKCVCPQFATVTNDICTCPQNSVLKYNICTCPIGSQLFASGCTCNGKNQIILNGLCTCPSGSTFTNGECKCPGEMELMNNECRCLYGQININNKCKCQIIGAQIINDYCSCPIASTIVDGTCICFPGSIAINGVCQCPMNLPVNIDGLCCPNSAYKNGNTCMCPNGAENIDGTCICTIQSSQIIDNKCVCPINATIQNNQCVCPLGSYLASNICVCSTLNAVINLKLTKPACECPLYSINSSNMCICPLNSILEDGQCKCITKNALILNSECTCPANSVNITNICTCPIGSSFINEICVCQTTNSFFVDGLCQCGINATNISNSCICPTGSMLQNGVCICSTLNAFPVSGVCQCAINALNSSNKCICPWTSVIVGGVCLCNQPSQYLKSGICECAINSTLVQGVIPFGATLQGNLYKCTESYYSGGWIPAGSYWCQNVNLCCSLIVAKTGDNFACSDGLYHTCTYDTAYPQNIQLKSCQCPVDSTFVGNTCVCKISGAYPINGACKCPLNSFVKDNTCTCPSGSALVNNICTCSTLNSIINTSLAEPICQCPFGATNSSNSCQCPLNSTLVNGVCKCTVKTQFIENGKCRCPINGTIICPTGASLIENQCVCTSDYAFGAWANDGNAWCVSINLCCSKCFWKTGDNWGCSDDKYHKCSASEKVISGITPSCDCPAGSTLIGNTCTCSIIGAYPYNNVCQCQLTRLF
ncbi:Conserved_hypothetical protein [Hexamita inflata]|uniref:Uncharacterized protein n=1 Tax=Hexamita inflata TaxID=28002 RepID=A0AA86QGF7_9EUKA|nr:Conserved hypothetical protein [Hexamita inflata]